VTGVASRRPSPVRTILAGALVVASVLTACTGDDDTAPTTTEAVTTTTIAPRVSDGVLHLGIFLPTTGPGAAIGPPMIAAINDAVATIDSLGGVLGHDIEMTPVDEGAGTIQDLLDAGVDAIIGPASSLIALSQLQPAVDANTGVVVCSPMATALALDNYPDHNLFFRTAPSDSLQMVAIARQAERTGTRSLAIGYLDDPYGRGLAESLEQAADGRPLEITRSLGFSSDQDDLTDIADQLLADDPGVVAVLGDADDGSRLLTALDNATTDPPLVIVNDTIRQARQTIQSLSPTFREQLEGVAPASGSMIDGAPSGFFVPHAVDCVNLIALAVIDAQSDDPKTFRREMTSVSSGGRVCVTFEGCAAFLEDNLGIDYNGLSGRLELANATGDPTRANFEVFGFDADGDEIGDVVTEVGP